MALRKHLEDFQERFTPRRRRIVGVALFAIWGVGLVVYPSSHWLYVVLLANIIFFSAWGPGASSKR